MKIRHEYAEDFYAWALHSARLMRESKFSEIDIINVAEELESMGKRDKQALINRFALLLAYSLKW